MKLKGEWSSGTVYDVEDVVRYSDNKFYTLLRPCKAGTPCADALYWNPLQDPLAQCAKMIMDMSDTINTSIQFVAALIPRNISDEAITLKGSEDAESLITVDDSGDTPELAVTLIEPEEEGDDT